LDVRPLFYCTRSPAENKYVCDKIFLMATIRLGRYEARQGNLPPVCIRCGIAASTYRNKVFVYSPSWIYLGIPFAFVPFFLLAWYRSKPARAYVPLCPLHRNLWRWQQPVLIAISALVSVGFGCLPLVLAFQGKYDSEKEAKIIVVASLAAVAGVALYVGASIALKYLGIHAIEVDAHGITLTGVAAEFVEALRVAHEGEASDQQRPGAAAPQSLEMQS